mmetsp:Transcript_2408/g.10006  ORF Transcript_2408/g.10006 Transcript_2408/m.10006 type:complete len:245 (+) Transcript_2408:707-1441(+)
MNNAASSAPPCLAVLMLVLSSAMRFRSSSSLSTISRIIALLSGALSSLVRRSRGESIARVVWSTNPTNSEVTLYSASSFPCSSSSADAAFRASMRYAKNSSVSFGRCLTISYSISLNSVSKKYATSSACVVGCTRASRAASSSSRAFSYSSFCSSSCFFSSSSSRARSFLSMSMLAAVSSTSGNRPSGSYEISRAVCPASSALSTFLRSSLSMARPSAPRSLPAVAFSDSAPTPSTSILCPSFC